MRRLRFVSGMLLLIALLLGLAGTAAAGETAPEAPDAARWRYPSGALELGGSVGGGVSFGHGRQSATLGAILPRLGLVLVEQEVFLPGSLALVGEPGFYLVGDGRTAAVAGLALLLKYRFWTRTRWIPFVLGGGGISYASEAIPHGASHFNFLGEAGLGIEYVLSAGRAVSLEWRFFHVSNGNTAATNPSINSGIILLGYGVSF